LVSSIVVTPTLSPFLDCFGFIWRGLVLVLVALTLAINILLFQLFIVFVFIFSLVVVEFIVVITVG
jgi:hypothetical protein